MTRQHGIIMALVLALWGCGGDDGTKVNYPELPDTTDAGKEIDPVADVWEWLDLGPVETVDIPPEPGELGYPCATNEECHSGFCVVTKSGPKCTMTCMEDCPEGWACLLKDPGSPDEVYICVPRYLYLCDPCNTLDDCKSTEFETNYVDQCLEFSGGVGSFCGADCTAGKCPSGFVCQDVELAGGTFKQCVPEDGTCECSLLASQTGKSTACSVTNEFGTCKGKRVCEEAGLSACDSGNPEAEKCDDVDNDCDGVTDEGCDDDKDGFCDKEMITLGKPASCGNGGGDCNDADSAVFPGANEICDSKDNNCDGVPDEGLCEDGNACTDDLCDPVEGCSHPFNAAACDDGNECTENDHCFEGKCSGAQKSCDDNNPCTDNLCNPLQPGGCNWPNNSAPCDEDDKPCTIDVCEGGTCQHKLASNTPCDDGNPCTDGDLCQSGQCVAGPPKKCADENQCTQDSCDTGQGCVHKVMNGTACQYDVADLGLCILQGTCGSNGCVPTPNCQCPSCLLCVCCSMFQICLDNLLPGGN